MKRRLPIRPPAALPPNGPCQPTSSRRTNSRRPSQRIRHNPIPHTCPVSQVQSLAAQHMTPPRTPSPGLLKACNLHLPHSDLYVLVPPAPPSSHSPLFLPGLHP